MNWVNLILKLSICSVFSLTYLSFIHLPFFHSFSSNLFSRFVAPQTGSGGRYMGQQNSPVPSPYTPQSPAPGYIQQYAHQQPPSYNQTQQMQGETLYLSVLYIHVYKKSVLVLVCIHFSSDIHGLGEKACYEIIRVNYFEWVCICYISNQLKGCMKKILYMCCVNISTPQRSALKYNINSM